MSERKVKESIRSNKFTTSWKLTFEQNRWTNLSHFLFLFPPINVCKLYRRGLWKIMFKETVMECIVPIVSMKVENYAELWLPRSAIERWNNEPCLSIFQGSRMQANDRLGREAAARPADEILVSCADTYRSIRTLILIYSVRCPFLRFKIVFCSLRTWIDAPRSTSRGISWKNTMKKNVGNRKEFISWWRIL